MLALVAGEGALPGVVLEALDVGGVAYRLCEMEGHPCAARGDRPVTRFRVETLGSFIADLKQGGVSEICFAGRVARPRLDPSAIDAATMPLVPRMMAALQAGDDGALRLVLGFFEEAGITIRAAHELVADLLPSAGVRGAIHPNTKDKKDAVRGVEIIGAMAKVDVGQACVVAGGQALAIEAIGGTDWMLRSLLVAPKGAGEALLSNDTSWDDPIGLAADWLTGTGQATRAFNQQRDPDLPDVLLGDGVKVYLIAGEPSGDKLGAALMEGLKTLHPSIEFHGSSAATRPWPTSKRWPRTCWSPSTAPTFAYA